MTEAELRKYRYQAGIEFGINHHVLEVIPKDQLKVGYWYMGYCRNSNHAQWTGSNFVYWRIKFGLGYWEKINHFEDDKGADVFVPVRIKGTTR